MPLKASAVIVAGGTGARMGRPKQFLPLLGKPMVRWSVEAFLQIPEIREVILVLEPDALRREDLSWAGPKVKLAEAGATRMESVRSGFEAVARDADVVAVHDGARPLVSVEVIRRCLEEAQRSGAAVAAVASVDTVKEASPEGIVVATPDRARLYQAQTPQCYRRPVLEKALGPSFDREATDESQLVERSGGAVRLVPSTRDNLKVTTPEDLLSAEALLARRQGGSVMGFRTGYGYDIHRMVPGRPLFLGGVNIPHLSGLLGHSDGDAALHAIADALLGAIGQGEIGEFFPPGQDKTLGVSSRVIVAKVLELMKKRGAQILNVDLTVVAEEPRLRPHYAAMRRSIAEILGVSEAQVNVKAKSHEGLGPVGRAEAVACHAVAAVVLGTSA